MVQELLHIGVIRSSLSPYTSPSIMVKKKDGSWRMCIDYGKLDTATTKDKFPIPIIKKLLDELSDANFFAKLYSRSRYHQIRIRHEDIEKTIFRSHHGHYEFMMMSFCFTNAPYIFQSLISHILQAYLRKFILIFFLNDILTYSSFWSSHLVHLESAFQTLQLHSLFDKLSKCSFGETSRVFGAHYWGRRHLYWS